MNLDVERWLVDLSGRYARDYTDSLRELLVHMARGNGPATSDARQRLASIIAETMGIGEVIGASLLLRSAAGILSDEAKFSAGRGEMLRFKEAPLAIANVTFQEAVDDMVSRTPRVIRAAAQRTAYQVSKLYSEGRVVAFARSAELAVTKRVQALIAESLRDGIVETVAGRAIRASVAEIAKRTEDWTDSYARMAFRTNVNTAVTAGRFRQARDSDIAKVIPAFRFDAIGDGDTRPNHRAADGIILLTTNPKWGQIAPPLGYSCRCQVSLVTGPQLRRDGRIDENGRVIESWVPPAAKPDDGFRHAGRPDLFSP